MTFAELIKLLSGIELSGHEPQIKVLPSADDTEIIIIIRPDIIDWKKFEHLFRRGDT